MRLACIVLLLALTAGLNAQDAATPSTSQLEQEVEAYRRVLLDWGGLTRYGSDDAELKLKPGQARVIFLGDEITEMWGRGKRPFFPGKPYVNRGITRQTAAQMLVRFRQDVLDLNPDVVIIEAGTNDLAGVMGPSSEGTIADHIRTMVELAKLHNIHVVLASVTPVCDCFQNMTARRSPVRINGLNRWLKSYAQESGSVYLDFYSALANGRMLKQEFTSDGFLPNDAAYQVMEPLAEHAIAAASGK